MNNVKKATLILGVGINDADYVVQPRVNGKVVVCPFYRAWRNMIFRCYGRSFHKKHPSYIGCSVSKDWLTFSNFKAWMETQDWEGLDLDKDLLIPGNKLYSEKTCVFVPRYVNTLLLDCANSRGKYPLGVCRPKNRPTYKARISLYKKTVYIGSFGTPEEAHMAYIKAKVKHIRGIANTQTEVVASILRCRATLLENGIIN